jgi:hypothetical protein
MIAEFTAAMVADNRPNSRARYAPVFQRASTRLRSGVEIVYIGSQMLIKSKNYNNLQMRGSVVDQSQSARIGSAMRVSAWMRPELRDVDQDALDPVCVV